MGLVAPAVRADTSSQTLVADATSAPDEATAKQIAAAYGHDVVVSSEESPTIEIVAQADGLLRLTETTEPVRAQVDGQWAAVDTSLEEDAGMLRPAVSAVPVAFSPGGSIAPLAEIQAPSGQWVSQTWKLGALPAPTVDGTTRPTPTCCRMWTCG